MVWISAVVVPLDISSMTTTLPSPKFVLLAERSGRSPPLDANVTIHVYSPLAEGPVRDTSVSPMLLSDWRAVATSDEAAL